MSRFYPPRTSAIDGNGDPISGAKLYFYNSGTTTPINTYADPTLAVANQNPMTADASGRFGDIFLSPVATYKAILKDADDVTLWTVDPVDEVIIPEEGPDPLVFPEYSAGDVIGWDEDDPVLKNYELDIPEEKNRKMSGRVTGSTGAVTKGTPGFSVVRSATGTYAVTFDETLPDDQYGVVPGLAEDTAGVAVNITGETTAGFTVKIRNAGGGGLLQDADWSFLLTYYVSSQSSITVPNGSFETGDLTYWNVVAGNANVQLAYDNGAITPHDGSYLLGASVGDTVSQTKSDPIDLVGGGMSTTAIDAGLAYLTVGCHQLAAGSGNDEGRFGLRFLESDGTTEISVQWGTYSDPVSWTRRSFRQIVPADTRYVEVLTYSKSDSGSYASAYFDLVTLSYDERI